MIATSLKYFGRLNVLVNNLGFGGSSSKAGLFQSRGISEINEQEWADAFDMNLNSIMLASRHAIPVMAKDGGASIINVCSGDGISS